MDPPVLSPYFFRDLANGIHQQMFFWGQDVLHPEGNFLVSQGFHRSPSPGLKGTSCYRKKWQGGHIELYGSCAGWYGKKGGFTYISPQGRCVRWLSEKETPIPGQWQVDLIDTRTTKAELYQAFLPFLDWLIAYEQAALARFGTDYREANFQKFKKVPKAKAWLHPAKSLRWFQCFRDNPLLLERPKKFSQQSYA